MSEAYGIPTNVPAVLPPPVFAAIQNLCLLQDEQDDYKAAMQSLADAIAAAVAAFQLDPGQAAAIVAAYGVTVPPTPAQQPA